MIAQLPDIGSIWWRARRNAGACHLATAKQLVLTSIHNFFQLSENVRKWAKDKADLQVIWHFMVSFII